MRHALVAMAFSLFACGGPSGSSSAIDQPGQPGQAGPIGVDSNGDACTCGDDGSDGGGGGCTLTQGYWKNHPQAWPILSLTIGGVSYSQDELLALFGTSPGGDASLILGHQLIAAMLNVASGASPASATTSAISDAQAWMSANGGGGKLPYGVSSSSAAGMAAIALGAALDQFNMGGAGVAHCQDGPGSGPQGGSHDCDCSGGGADAGCDDGGSGGGKPPPIGSGDPGGTGGGGVGVL